MTTLKLGTKTLTIPTGTKCLVYKDGVRCENDATVAIPGIGNVCSRHGCNDGQDYDEKDCACGGSLAVPSVDPDNESGYAPCPDCTPHFPHSLDSSETCIWCGMFSPDGACPALNHPNRKQPSIRTMTTEALNFKAEHFSNVIRISVGHRRDVIEIYKPRTAFGELQPAQINWSALGSVTPEFAARFAEAMLYAVQTANDLNEYSFAK